MVRGYLSVSAGVNAYADPGAIDRPIPGMG